jgi:hypothetical protein
MWTRTFVVSFVVHVLVVGGTMVARIMAATELPDPPQITSFVIVTPDTPAIPPPARAPARATPAVNPNAAPIVEPEGVRPEVPTAPIETPIGPGTVPGAVAGDVDAILGVEPPPPVRRVEPAAPVRVGGDIRAPQKVYSVPPIYPDARQRRRDPGSADWRGWHRQGAQGAEVGSAPGRRGGGSGSRVALHADAAERHAGADHHDRHRCVHVELIADAAGVMHELAAPETEGDECDR